jgi:DNA-binding response OmpR family regulator
VQEKVLIIDDEDFILQLSRDILAKSHYVIKTTSDGKEGLSLLKTDKLVLSHFKWVTQVRQAQSDNGAFVMVSLSNHMSIKRV